MKTHPRWLCVAAALLFTWSAAAADTKSLCDVLARSDGATDEAVIVAALDQLRAMGKDAAPAAETLSGLLSHRSKLYRDRDKYSVVRLRAYVMVALSEVGVPSSALPALGHANSPLMDTVERMEKRIYELEHPGPVQPPLAALPDRKSVV